MVKDHISTDCAIEEPHYGGSYILTTDRSFSGEIQITSM